MRMTALISMQTKDNQTTSPGVPEPWVNLAAACTHLGISIPTGRRWLKAKKLSPKRTPTGGLRFRLSDLDSLLG